MQDGAAHRGRRGDCLLLVLYYDGFQVGNPLGNKAKKQTLGGLYCSIGNTEHRGKLNEIFCVLLFQEELLEKYSWAQILKPLLTDILQLEAEGVKVGGRLFQVRLAVLTGDNLGVHAIAGFAQNFSGGPMMCRHCHGTPDEIRTKTRESDFQLRSRESYETRIRLLEEEDFSESMCKTLGIKRSCPFSGLVSFHPMESLPPDVMHDVLEGVAPSTINLILTDLLAEKTVDGQALNNTMRTFPYSSLDTNRPGRLVVCGTKGSAPHLRRSKPTANETWVLLRLLPLLLLHAGVSASSLGQRAGFRLILQLIRIMQILATFALSHREVEMLRCDIEEFLSNLLRCFPNVHLTPKHHYLIHYPFQILRHGPLRHLWVMRFEGFHQVLKRSILNSRNRKNICRSIALRQQVHATAEQLAGHEGRPSERLMFKGPVPEECKPLIQGAQLYRRIKCDGVEYRSGEAINIAEGLAEVICICDKQGSYRFLVRHVMSSYDSSIGAFRVTRMTTYSLECLGSLRDPLPLGLYEVNGCLFSVPRHILRGTGMT